MAEAWALRNSRQVKPDLRGEVGIPCFCIRIPDRSRRDDVAKLEQLATNPDVAPAGILLAESEDELPALLVDPRSARTTAPTERGPLAANQRPMPAQECLRAH